MKLRNKRTGEIATLTLSSNGEELLLMKNNEMVTRNVKLSDLEEWEDAPEEPKGSALDLMILTLTNFIENEPDEDKVDLEDCKQMLEKLKAWKRLRDKGFRFIDHIDRDSGQGMTRYEWDGYVNGEDLDLLFCPEENI